MSKTGENTWKAILIPFSWLYGLVIRIRNSLYDHGFFKSTGFGFPLISVGNITVGGTGKTPHVEYLVELLGKEYRVATLSRGYKRRTRDFRIAATDSKAWEIGDEPLQLKRKYPELCVAVDRKRVHGAEMLMKQDPPPEVLVLDDAYQHRSIKAGLSILLIDYARPVYRDRLLPAGMLREPASNLNRADIIIVTRSPEEGSDDHSEYADRLGISRSQSLYFTSMRYGELHPVFAETPARDAAWFKNKVGAILVVSGIAGPGNLRQFALSINSNLAELAFPDHHHYTRKDIGRISTAYNRLRKTFGEVLVLTTEKDAVRLQDLDAETGLRDAIYSVRIHVHFLNRDREKFEREILNYVKSY